MLYRIAIHSKRTKKPLGYAMQVSGKNPSYPLTFLDLPAALAEAERLNKQPRSSRTYHVEPDEAVRAA